MRECRKCKQDKPLTEFRKCAKGPGGVAWWCKTCTDEGARKQPSGQYFTSRWYKIKWQYNVTKEQYYQMLESQGNVCAICGTDSPGRKNAKSDDENQYFLIDHDHACCPGGKSSKVCGQCVRGLVCFKCNVLLSMAEDDPIRLAKAIDYLSVPRQG